MYPGYHQQPQQPPPQQQPQRYLYGNPQQRFHRNQSYNINGYMYRFTGMVWDQSTNQRLPMLELLSEQQMPGYGPPQHSYAPRYVMQPHGYGMPDPYQPPPQPGQQPDPYNPNVYNQPFVAPPIHQQQPGDRQQYRGRPRGGQRQYDPGYGPRSQRSGPQKRQDAGFSFLEPSLPPEIADEARDDAAPPLAYETEKTWQIGNYTCKNCVLINDKNAPPQQHRNSQYLSEVFTRGQLDQSMVELNRKMPTAFICEVKRPRDEEGDHFACVYDKTLKGYAFSSRLVTPDDRLQQQVLCIDENGNATERQSYDFSNKGQGINVRVLFVGQNGWLFYFAPDRPWILTEYKYLVFTSPKSQVLFRRVFDTKRTDGKELFLKHTMLSAQPPVDGMAITQAVVQRDTPNDGSFVVVGNGNAIIAMTQMQTMLSKPSGESTKHYYDKGGQGTQAAQGSPPRSRSPQRTPPQSPRTPPSGSPSTKQAAPPSPSMPALGSPYRKPRQSSPRQSPPSPQTPPSKAKQSPQRIQESPSRAQPQSSTAGQPRSKTPPQAPGPETGAIPKRRGQGRKR